MAIASRDMQVFEILDEIGGIKADVLKIEMLRTKYSDHIPLHRILKMNFCDSIQSIVPEGAPPFNREKVDGPNRASLWAYVQQFPYFVKSAVSAKLRPLQVEKIFIEMLEAVDVEEAEMVILAKDKKLTTKWNISAEVVTQAFPQLKIVASEPPKIKTPEERAEELLDLADVKKTQAKQLQDEAKKLIAEAKALASEVE